MKMRKGKYTHMYTRKLSQKAKLMYKFPKLDERNKWVKKVKCKMVDFFLNSCQPSFKAKEW